MLFHKINDNIKLLHETGMYLVLKNAITPYSDLIGY